MSEHQSVESIISEQMSLLLRRSPKTHQELEWSQQVSSLYELWQKLKVELADLEEMIIKYPQEYAEDLEWQSLIDLEIAQIGAKISNRQQQLQRLLLDPHPDKYRNILLEINALAGDDANGWMRNLIQMYTRYAENNECKVLLVSEQTETASGLDSKITTISGLFAGCLLQFGSGIHLRENSIVSDRTEATAMTRVIPIVDYDEIEIDVNDIEMEMFRPARPLKMSVNKLTFGVNLLHKPTGIHIVCDRRLSQTGNKGWAIEILRSKLYALNSQQQLDEDPQSIVVRIYDYRNNCVTDLSSGIKYSLDRLLNGYLDSSTV
jgi:peptide chain release factor 1